MAEQWTGRSKGTSLGFKIFIFTIKRFGIKAAYSVLFFVAAYYFLFSFKSSKVLFFYFHKIRNYGVLKSLGSIYKNYFIFGQTLIDRFAIPMGLQDSFTFDFYQNEIIKKTEDNGKGGVMISAHIGNFEVTGHFLNAELDNPMNMVTLDTGDDTLDQFLADDSSNKRIKFIKIKKGSIAHMIEIGAAVKKNELVCFTGDRHMGGKTYTANFFGKPAQFPAGVFDIASKLKVPVLFVFAMKDTATHYQFSCHEASGVGLKPEEILGDFILNVEKQLNHYPYQWFNYYQFWNTPN
ncbi:MAG: lipid A biosynthesis acyltransferase [Crocinitomicaceae bacterium]|nr:lipid A biosynthesis acyltransferase [Crocinitomicaceae bacterium]|tara:strand:- start:2385 stop:3263 length:879 start_codon:yes stop_codon:yes gene_type:complete